jgi:hypothetical protein
MKFTGQFSDLKKIGYKFVGSGPACWFKRIVPGDFCIWIFKKDRRIIIDDAGEFSDAYANWVVGEYFGSCALAPHLHGENWRKVAIDTKTGRIEPYKLGKHSWPFVAAARGLTPDTPEPKEERERYRFLQFNDRFQQMVQQLLDLHIAEIEEDA